MNVLYVNIHRRSIFFDRFFFFSLFSVKNFRGNEEILILILWEESCLHCEVFFWSEWFFWRSKSCTRGEEKSWKIAQRGFSLTIHVLCFFLVGIYIFFFFGMIYFLLLRERDFCWRYENMFSCSILEQSGKKRNESEKRGNYRSNVPI